MKWHLDRPELLVADVPWEQLIEALRSTSGERFEVLGTVSGDWWAWMYQQHPESRGRTWSRVGWTGDPTAWVMAWGWAAPRIVWWCLPPRLVAWSLATTMTTLLVRSF